MPGVLSVSRYKAFANSSDVGHVARFRVTGKQRDGLILQYVKHTTCFNADKKQKTRRFTEAWKVRDSVVQYGGKDWFLIPRQYHTSTGVVSLTAHAWFVAGDADKLLAAVGMDDSQGKSPVSGALASERGKVPEKYRRSSGVRRSYCVSWSKHPTARGFKPDEVIHWRD
jgi:hypothetical protein